LKLLSAFALSIPIRLIGVGAGNLQPASMPVQRDLFEEARNHQRGQWEKVDQVMDAIAERYGSGSIVRGTLAAGKPRKDK
jgi:hypothetical protein